MRQSLKLLYSELDKNGGGGGGRQREGEDGSLDCGIPRRALVKDINVFRQSDSFSGLLVTIADAQSSSDGNVRNPDEFEVMFSPVSGFQRFDSEGTLAKRITGLEVRTYMCVVLRSFGSEVHSLLESNFSSWVLPTPFSHFTTT